MTTSSHRYINIKLAADMISTFDGKTPLILSFIRACQSAEESILPGDKHLLMRLVRNKIVGNADLYLQNNAEPTSISSLLDTLRATFNPRRDLSQLQARISNLIQGNNESVVQYGIRVSEILRKTLDAIEEGFPKETITGMKMGTNKNAVSCFTRGLHKSIENRMQNRHATNLQGAINSAVTIENELECSYGTYNAPECYGCGKPGHYKKNCPGQKFTNYSHRTNKMIGSCGLCQRQNHYEENCLAKRKFGNRSQNFSNGPQGGVKEKTRQPLLSISRSKPSGSKHVGSFAPSTPQN